MFGLLKRRPHARAGLQLYATAVAQARQPYYFASLGVPDTLDGRFDMVALFAFLLIDRLQQDGPPEGRPLAQAVFDAMFADMDQNLRQMGVGDLSVGSRVKAMWTAFNGRAHAYAEALDAAGTAALERALARNVWRSTALPAGAGPLAREFLLQRRQLAGWPSVRLVAGEVEFLPPGAA